MYRRIGLLALLWLPYLYVWFFRLPADIAVRTPLAPSYRLLNASAPPEETYPLRELESNDTSTLIDLSNFHWRMGNVIPSVCAEEDGPLIIALVHTAPDHAAHRKNIRETWGAQRQGFLVRFMLGSTTPSLQESLEKEQDAYGDLVQGSFLDSYRNLTYKHIMVLKWAAYFCPKAPYVLKMDDDVLVNTPELIEFVRNELSPHGARNLLLCTLAKYLLPIRSHRSKWQVTHTEYLDSEYPIYCVGGGILYSADAVFRLYRQAQKSRYFWIDDVQVTGVLSRIVGLTPGSWEPFVLDSVSVRRVLRGEDVPFLFSPIHTTLDVRNKLWQTVQRQNS